MAANITDQYFLTLFPEFGKVDRATIAAYLDIATMRVPMAVWGGPANTIYQYATALMLAHMLASSGKTGAGSAGGPITAEAVGDLSRSYGTVAEAGSGDSWLATTRYGIDFINLRNENMAPMGVTGAISPPWCP